MVTEEDVDMIRLTTELRDSEAKLLKQLWELDSNDEAQNDSNSRNEVLKITQWRNSEC